MTETLTNVKPQLPDEETCARLGAALNEWVESPPPSVSAALAERGLNLDTVEECARAALSADELEALRKVLVHGAASGDPEDATLLARLTPVLDPRERAWDRVIRAKNSGEVLTAPVTEAVKGGVVVDLGVRGFVPSSQIGLNVPRNLNQFVGQTMRVRVLEVDRRRQTVILTNRQILEEERASKRRDAIRRLEEGEVRDGTVRRLTDIGAFVDVGGVDGLLHVSEISWKRVEHPRDVLKVGQKIPVKILRVDPSSGRVSLSMRRLMADPWEEARRKYPIGSTSTVKIAETVPQGAVVELQEGLEGFIPISELAPRRIAAPEEVVQPGQEVEAVVIDLRPRERRVVFSLRKLEQKKERQVVESYQRKVRSTSERTTLGDLFGHLFEELRRDVEEPEEEAAAPAAEAVAEQSTAGPGVTEAPEAASAEPVAVEAAAPEAAAPEAPAEPAPVEAQAAEDTQAVAEAQAPAETAGETAPIVDESGSVEGAVVGQAEPTAEGAAAEEPAPKKRRSPRKKAEAAETAESEADAVAEATVPAGEGQAEEQEHAA